MHFVTNRDQKHQQKRLVVCTLDQQVDQDGVSWWIGPGISDPGLDALPQKAQDAFGRKGERPHDRPAGHVCGGLRLTSDGGGGECLQAVWTDSRGRHWKLVMKGGVWAVMGAQTQDFSLYIGESLWP